MLCLVILMNFVSNIKFNKILISILNFQSKVNNWTLKAMVIQNLHQKVKLIMKWSTWNSKESATRIRVGHIRLKKQILIVVFSSMLSNLIPELCNNYKESSKDFEMVRTKRNNNSFISFNAWDKGIVLTHWNLCKETFHLAIPKLHLSLMIKWFLNSEV